MNRLIVIVGPTAVGKTHTSICLAKSLNTEIISADSRQVYTEMEIGTAKPTKEELGTVKHHFINCRSIHENYDSGIYGRESIELLTRLFQSYHTLIMVGGSGLYIKSALEGFDSIPKVYSEIRVTINNEYSQKGLGWLQNEIKVLDPDYFKKVDTKNHRRLIRALEVIRATNKPFSSFQSQKVKTLPFEILKIGLTMKREEINRKIDIRVDKMITAGLFEEVFELLPFQHLNALKTVGYQEVIAYFNHLKSRDEAINLIKQNSHRFAKRQMTWFKKDSNTHWVSPTNIDSIWGIINQKSNK